MALGLGRMTDEEMDPNDPAADPMFRQAMLQQLQSGPARTTQPVPVTPAAATETGQAGIEPPPTGAYPPADNGGVAGDKSAAQVGSTDGSAKGAANPAWDTDGYAAPSYTAPSAGGAMPGWDATKWDDPNNQHPKYVVGRILSQHSFDDAGTQDAVKEIMQAYPGTTFDGKDKITIPGVGTIDFRKGASKGGEGWQWDTGEGAATGAATGAGGAAPILDANGQPVSSAVAGLSSPSTYTALMQKLQSILGPESVDQQTLMSQLKS